MHQQDWCSTRLKAHEDIGTDAFVRTDRRSVHIQMLVRGTGTTFWITYFHFPKWRLRVPSFVKRDLGRFRIHPSLPLKKEGEIMLPLFLKRWIKGELKIRKMVFDELML